MDREVKAEVKNKWRKFKRCHDQTIFTEMYGSSRQLKCYRHLQTPLPYRTDRDSVVVMISALTLGLDTK